MARVAGAADSNVFDVPAYVAFALPSITRALRVEDRKTPILTRHVPSCTRPLISCSASTNPKASRNSTTRLNTEQSRYP